MSTPRQIDARGARFGAAVTAVVVAVGLGLGPHWGWGVVAFQAVIFGLGAVVGPHAQPYGLLFRRLIAGHLSGAPRLEDARPPRFAQGVGLVFVLTALVGVAIDSELLFYIAAAGALFASLLNAIFDFCLGCELYLLGIRLINLVRRRSGKTVEGPELVQAADLEPAVFTPESR